MKKLVCKTTAALLLATLVMASFSACTGGETQTDINLDIDLTQKPMLSVLMPNSGYDDTYINEDPNAQVVEDVTGNHVEYSQLPATNASTTLNLQLIDREPYNAMKLTSAQFADLIAQDVLLDLTPAIEKFGDVLQEVISEESWATVTVDGKIYGIPERSSSDNIQYPIVFRQDWLDELNLNIPTTLEEFRTVLEALKQKMVDDGDTVNAPLTFDMYTPIVWAIAAGFGIYAEWQEYTVDGQTKVLYYMDSPNYADYVDYMADLYADGLIDTEVATNDSATAISKFTNDRAACISTSIWSVSSIVNGLVSGADANTTQENLLGYLRALENEDGEEHANRLGGCSYVTCIPFYMAENAGYVIDWINEKLTDTEEEHNFRDIVIGEEGYHWTYNATEGYIPLSENFSEKDTASYYLTGSNELVYTQYWLARVRKQAELYRAWSLMMEDADEVGVYNVLDWAPPLEEYASYRSIIELYAQDQFFVMMIQDGGSSNLAQYLSTWSSDGGAASTEEINAWYYAQ